MSSSLSSPSSPISSVISFQAPLAATKVKHDDFFYFNTVVFKAEDTWFRVPRYGLPSDGAAFEAMFSREPNGPGSSDDDPIILDSDVTAADFRSLLKAYLPPSTTRVTLTVDEWMSVLKLSKKWGLVSMKEKAVAECDKEISQMPVVDRIVLGKKYAISKWLQEAYCALASRTESITADEIDKLGWETYRRVMDIRERSFVWYISSLEKSRGERYCDECDYRHGLGGECKHSELNGRETFSYSAAVCDSFGDELATDE